MTVMDLKRWAVVMALSGAVAAAGCSKDPNVAKREFVQSGDSYVAQQKYAEAIIQYRNAVQQDARFGEARLKLADAYAHTGDVVNAAREYVRAADLMPEDPTAQLKAGNMLLILRQFPDAQGRADKVLARDPKNVEAQILRANALAGLKKFGDAVSEVEAAIDNDPDRGASYANLATLQMVQGHAAEAEAGFKKALELDPKSVPAHLAIANFYLATGRIDEAESALKAAVAIDPRGVLANRALGYLYMGTHRAAEAERYLKVVAAAAPGNAGRLALADYYVAARRPEDARKLLASLESGTSGRDHVAVELRLASLEFDAGDTAAAARRIDGILTTDPKDADALVARSHILLKTGRVDDALTAAQQAALAAPQSAKVKFVLGLANVAHHNDTDAMTAFNEALRLDPGMAAAEMELARLDLRAGRLSQATELAESAAKRLSDNPDVQLLRAQIYLAAGDAAKAEPVLTSLARTYPDSPDVQNAVGALQLHRGRRAAARAAFTAALTHDPANAAALTSLVAMDLQDKRPRAATARVDAAVAAAPRNAALLTVAGRTYAEVGSMADAERLLRRAVEADPNALDAYAALGQIYLAGGRTDDAIAQYREMADKQPKSVTARTIVGVLLDMQHRTNDARAVYEQILQTDAHAAVAANNLAWIYAEQGGNLDLALQLAQTAKATLPQSAEVNDTIGWIYYKKGLGSLAVPALQESVDESPKTASYHYHLGLAYTLTGDAAKARSAFERSLALDSTSAAAADVRRALAGLKG
jgi:putative PEP-CTERM system TPR-repeat lipoprotein